ERTCARTTAAPTCRARLRTAVLALHPAVGHTPSMEWTSFLQAIAAGRLPVAMTCQQEDDVGLEQALRRADEMVRIDGKSNLPEFDAAAACWAAEQLRALCMLRTDPDLPSNSNRGHHLRA